MAGKTILVTGAAGFIGSHLCEALLRRGDRVVGLDNFDTPYARDIKESNLRGALTQRDFEFYEGDIRDPDTLAALTGAHHFDVVTNLAARAGVRQSIAEPLVFDSVNVLGTTCILNAVRDGGVPHLVQASSSSVYGSYATPPFSETAGADRPSSPYAATKRSNELAAHAYWHLYGFSTTCLRFFTVYGPRQRPEMAIHKFTRQIEHGQPVDMYGDGGSRRDYTFVEDVVSGVVAAIDRPAGYRIYNLGTTDTTRLRDLLDKIASRLDRELLINQLDDQLGDVPLTHADISRAQDELDYRPGTTIDAGLDRFVEWYRSRGQLSRDGELVGAGSGTAPGVTGSTGSAGD